MKRLAVLTAAFAMVGGVAWGSAAEANPPKPPCQPGQQGNPDPGFKPGVCDNK